MQPRRDGRVRCSAWLGGTVISHFFNCNVVSVISADDILSSNCDNSDVTAAGVKVVAASMNVIRCVEWVPDLG